MRDELGGVNYDVWIFVDEGRGDVRRGGDGGGGE